MKKKTIKINDEYKAIITKDNVIVTNEITLPYSTIKELYDIIIENKFKITGNSFPKINWEGIENGTWFSAEIEGNSAIGKISKENDEIYLCQNVMDGTPCSYKQGFYYS